MKVTTASARVAEQRYAAQQPSQAEQPKLPQQDEFQANSPEKHRVGYEVAYNFGSAVDGLTRAVSKTGQYFQLSSLALGMEPAGLAGILGLMGGTYDIATGASLAKQSAVNRNMSGTVMGSLKALQGVATYAAVLAPMFGAPGVVGRAAAFVAIGALAGRLGMQGVGAAKGLFGKEESEQAAAPSAPAGGASSSGFLAQSLDSFSPIEAQGVVKQTEAEKTEEDAASGDSRTFEKLFAANGAVDSFCRRLGGIGAFWNNIESLWGGQPGGVWGVLGIVGSTYSVAQGAAELRHSTVNRNKAGTIDGTLHLVQGLASVGTSLGMGRAAGLVATGAFVGRYAYMIYNQAKEMNDDEETVGQVVKDTVNNAFFGNPSVEIA
ncbi:MAG: hypothetical protein HY319_09125 [Armatimonadetes bacterium]|nr:hypothetical protein [Armatimonadota bacterium]